MNTNFFGLTKWFSIISVLLLPSLRAQITLTITQIPENSSHNIRLFFASSLNGWKADDPKFEFKETSDGVYSLTIPSGNQKIEYKIIKIN